MHVPAVVGSWPQPFAGGYDGKRHPVRVECRGGGGACSLARRRVVAAAAAGSGQSSGQPIRVLVGPWRSLRSDPNAARLEQGPQSSGVFARFEPRAGGFALRALDQSGKPGRLLLRGAGLVAATRSYDSPPLWLVTGTDQSGVRAAAGLLGGAELRNRYAVATRGGSSIGLPLR